MPDTYFDMILRGVEMVEDEGKRDVMASRRLSLCSTHSAAQPRILNSQPLTHTLSCFASEVALTLDEISHPQCRLLVKMASKQTYSFTQFVT